MGIQFRAFYDCKWTQGIYGFNRIPEQLFRGKIVAAKTAGTEVWGRAKVIRVNENKDEFLVTFLDFGHLMLCGRDKIATFVNHLFGKLPIQAFHSRLFEMDQNAQLISTLNIPLISTILRRFTYC